MRQPNFAMDAETATYLKSLIRTVPDFPRLGIQFRDITTLLLDPKGFQCVIDTLSQRYANHQIDAVACCESRGFIIGAPLALGLKCAFVPIRKPRKLPSKTISIEYKTEYSTDMFEVHIDAIKSGQRVLVVDDLIATGGTLEAACQLVEQCGATVVECACLVELPELQGRSKLADRSLYTMLSFDGE